MISTFQKSVIPLLFSFLWSYSVDASDNLTLPSLQSLQATLTTFTTLERDSKLKALETTKSGPWQDLLPSLGVMYNLQGDPRPSASWSPLQILDRRDRKRKAKLDRESIILTYELILTDRIYKLNQLYHDYMIDLEALKAKKEGLTIDEKLFEITERKYQENLIKPSEYLTAKKAVMNIRTNLLIAQQEILKAKNEILYYAKWN